MDFQAEGYIAKKAISGKNEIIANIDPKYLVLALQGDQYSYGSIYVRHEHINDVIEALAHAKNFIHEKRVGK